jgi:hypothetical protein
MRHKGKIDVERDKRICQLYQYKPDGQYVLTVSELALSEGITPVVVYKILKRNGIAKRSGAELWTDVNKVLEITSEAILSAKNVKVMRRLKGWEVWISE